MVSLLENLKRTKGCTKWHKHWRTNQFKLQPYFVRHPSIVRLECCNNLFAMGSLFHLSLSFYKQKVLFHVNTFFDNKEPTVLTTVLTSSLYIYQEWSHAGTVADVAMGSLSPAPIIISGFCESYPIKNKGWGRGNCRHENSSFWHIKTTN